MASNMKGFFRQRKTIAKSPKPSSSFSSTNKKKSPLSHASTIGSDVVQPPALISHGSVDLKDDYDENEQMLRQFDMNMVYGPCLGMTRMGRWERARRLGLHPPNEIEHLLKTGKTGPDCLWDGRV